MGKSDFTIFWRLISSAYKAGKAGVDYPLWVRQNKQVIDETLKGLTQRGFDRGYKAGNRQRERKTA